MEMNSVSNTNNKSAVITAIRPIHQTCMKRTAFSLSPHLTLFLTLSLSLSLDALRRILCQVGLQKGPEGEDSMVDTFMLCDSKMWKGEAISL